MVVKNVDLAALNVTGRYRTPLDVAGLLTRETISLTM
jgi:hypothetical protein